MRDYVDAQAVIAATQALVAADTRNPPGNERLAADVGRQLLEPLGATFAEIEPEPGRTSLLATVGAADGSRPILLINGHLDVVPIDRAGWSRDPFAGDVDGGRVWGRGTADMKGGIAAAIEAFHTLRRAGREPACDVIFHLVADEERGGTLGTGVLATQGLMEADACLVPEPTSLAVCIAERGLLHAEVTISGRPAHASEPSRGLSAIEKAARVVLAVHDADFGDPPHDLLGSPTANVGVIRGGSGANTVAERCILTIDRRTLPGVSAAQAADGLRRRIDSLADPELTYDLDITVFGEASEMPRRHPWVQRFQRAVTSVKGEAAPVIGMTFATDARFVRNDAGIPAIVFGPGGIEQAHVHDEWVAIDALVDATAIFAEIIATFDDATNLALTGGAGGPGRSGGPPASS